MNVKEFCQRFEQLQPVYEELTGKEKKLKKKDAQIESLTATAEKVTAYEHALEAFTGQVTADPDKPLLLQIPQQVYEGLVYTLDGVRYIATTTGIVKDLADNGLRLYDDAKTKGGKDK